jgi:L-lactate dehydrogenase complex protein LldG
LQLVADAAVARLAWPPEFSVQERPIKATDRVSIAWAVAGIAETGSVVLVPANGAALNFLPEAQIVIVSRLVGWIEQAYSLLTPWPRHVNFITGPSRTADIEQTLQLGAHGPRHLHVLLSDSSPA